MPNARQRPAAQAGYQRFEVILQRAAVAGHGAHHEQAVPGAGTRHAPAAFQNRARFIEAGIFIRPLERVIYLTPSYVIAPDDLDQLIDAVRREVG